jgi:hypothetical protein
MDEWVVLLLAAILAWLMAGYAGLGMLVAIIVIVAALN